MLDGSEDSPGREPGELWAGPPISLVISSPFGCLRCSFAVTGHACDVSDEAQVLRFRDELLEQHASGHVNLVFSNAGVAGGTSFVKDSRQEWERTFAINWQVISSEHFPRPPHIAAPSRAQPHTARGRPQTPDDKTGLASADVDANMVVAVDRRSLPCLSLCSGRPRGSRG